MKHILILLTLFLLLTSCSLVKEQPQPIITETETQTEKEVIGFRILLEDQAFDKPDNEIGRYYFFQPENTTFPYFITVDNSTIATENTTETTIEVDYYYEKNGCFLNQAILQDQEGNISYEGFTYTCTSNYGDLTITRNFTKTEDNRKESVEYTINFKGISTITNYQIIEFDEDYNKITENTLDFSQMDSHQITIELNENTYFYVIKESDLNRYDKSLTTYTVEDTPKIKNVFTRDGIKAQYFNIDFTYQNN